MAAYDKRTFRISRTTKAPGVFDAAGPATDFSLADTDSRFCFSADDV